MIKFLCTFFILLLATICLAADKTQQLITHKSQVVFAVSSELLNFRGNLHRYEGKIVFPSPKLEEAQVELTLDLSSAQFDGSPQQSQIISQLFGKIPQPIINFKSSEIRQVSKNRYSISGTVTQGSKNYQVKVPVKIISLTPTQSVFEVSHQETLKQLPYPVFSPILPPTSKGTVQARLVFR